MHGSDDVTEYSRRVLLSTAIARVGDEEWRHLLAATKRGEEGSHFLADSFARPDQFRRRVRDLFQLTTESARRTVTIDYVADADADSRVICLVRPVKGRELREFSVTGRTGANLRLLGAAERREIILRYLLTLLDEVAHARRLSPALQTWLEQFLAKLVLAQPDIRNSNERRRFEDQVVAYVRQFLAPSAPCCDDRSASVQRLSICAAKAGATDPVLAEIGGDDQGQVTYTQTDLYGAPNPHVQLDAGDRIRRIGSHIARWIGAIPAQVFLPPYKSTASGDYSIAIDVGAGNFVANAEAEGWDLVLRGLGTSTLQGSRALNRTRGGRARPLKLRLRQSASGAPLRSLALAVLVAGIIGAVKYSEFPGRTPTSGEPPRSLEVLSWAVSIVSIAVVAFWAILLRTVDQKVLPLGSVLTGLGSMVALILLTASLGLQQDPEPTVDLLLTGALLNSLTIGAIVVTQVLQRERIRGHDARVDLEGPFI